LSEVINDIRCYRRCTWHRKKLASSFIYKHIAVLRKKGSGAMTNFFVQMNKIVFKESNLLFWSASTRKMMSSETEWN
jgi:hypothetical protein